MTAPGLELPGSGGVPATFAYTVGALGTTLTFTNVVTRTREELTAPGTLAIFLKLDTTDNAFSGIHYKWMKRTDDASWVLATTEEIGLTVNSNGGFAGFHRGPTSHDQFGVAVPNQPSGSIAWEFGPASLETICSVAVSYDDKLGMRHFVGGAYNPGVTCDGE